MRNSFRAIAHFMDPVMTPNSIRELVNMHTFYNNEPRSFRNIWERHNSSRKREQKLLAMNTFLMSGIGSAPAVSVRRAEVGASVTNNNYNIMLFCEVWRNADRNKLVESMSLRPGSFVDAITLTKLGSSGLISISKELRIVRSQFHKFRHEALGDKHSDKGVLFMEVETGIGGSKLELYNTHMNFEERLLGNQVSQPKNLLRWGIEARTGQLQEIKQFFNRVHQRENPYIMGGDINIYALDSDIHNPNRRATSTSDEREMYIMRQQEYENFKNFLLELDLYDAWLTRNGTAGFTNAMDSSAANIICPTDSTDPHLCNDYRSTETHLAGTGAARIDYLLICKSQRSHSFRIDITRPRRFTKKRSTNADAYDEIAYISDHLGISTTLMLSPI